MDPSQSISAHISAERLPVLIQAAALCVLQSRVSGEWKDVMHAEVLLISVCFPCDRTSHWVDCIYIDSSIYLMNIYIYIYIYI